MKKQRIILLLFCAFTLLLCVPKTFAQSYYFRNYSVEDGLPFIEASVIFQDMNGNLWSGGYGGLSKFDGVQFTNYSPKDGLLNHLVTAINEDNSGDLWIGTISGINKFDGNKFTSYTTKDGLPSNTISCILKATNGDLWIGTDKGLSRFSEEVFTNYSVKNGLENADIRSLYQDKKGTIWIGTSCGISYYNGNKFENNAAVVSYFISSGSNEANIINGFSEDEQAMWIATEKGLLKCVTDTSGIKKYTSIEQCWNKSLSSVLVDARNTIWLGTEKGLIKYDRNTISKLSIRITQNSNIVHCLFQDYENNLWIGTSAGLFKYRGNPFISFGLNDGLTNNFIHGLKRDSHGNLWVGSQSGLFKYSNHQFTNYDEVDVKKGTNINDILEVDSKTLWLATNKGLMTYDDGFFIRKLKPKGEGVYKNPINTFFKDSKSNIWIAGNNEVYKYDGKEFIHYTFKSRSENYQAWCFVEDRQGNIWIGTYLGGLIKYDGKTFTECSEQLGFGNDSFLTSIIDKEGNLYFGCLNGVWMYNPSAPANKPINFSKADGMSSDLVYSLTFGKREDVIWAGTNQGLNQIDIAGYKKNGQKNIIPFGKQEGFTGVECNSNGTWVDADGSIWFGTVYGLIKYDPNEYIENKMESKISITGFSLFYNDTVLKNNVHLGYSDNNITFNFSGICLTNPGKVKYSYILEGSQKIWSPPSGERTTNYSNLPPGTYTFKVISTNNENVWNKTPATFTFTIERPYWKTWWFNTILFASLFISIFIYFRVRIHNIKLREKQKTELNKKIANIESQALRSQMNPHFIFNTLASIQDYIQDNDSESALRYLTKFAQLMRKIMENSKQQLITIAEEVNALKLYLELEVMRFKKKFEYHINIDANIDANYDQIPSMLIQPYVENAIKHGLLPKEGNGKLEITLERNDDTIQCIIEDNGVGRKKSMESKRNHIHQHKSMGMNITQERLTILNSSLKSNIYVEIIDLYENGEAAGTKVKLIIPLETNE